jgi:methyl-accepting chemotaxis protein
MSSSNVFNQLKLGQKFTALLLGVLIAGSTIGGLVLSNALQHKAEQQVASQGLLLMQTISSVRDYTDLEIRDLLQENLDQDEFLAQTVPSYSSRRVFEILHERSQFQDVSYKEAMLNPTNPNDQADTFEEELIRYFQEHPGAEELSDFRTLPIQGSFFFSARPIAINNPSCLECHGVPEDAPAAMLDKYGRENGFGWELGSTAGVQVAYVPAGDVFQAAQQSSLKVMSVFFGVFAIAILALNTLMKPTIIQPIQYLARASQRLGTEEQESSQTSIQVHEQRLAKVSQRRDELGQLAKIFQTMVQEVRRREQQLRDQVKTLRIEIDQSRREREVNEITESDYFQNLQKKAREYRRRDGKSPNRPSNPKDPS